MLHIQFSEIDSTQRWALAHKDLLEEDDFWIVSALKQNAGYGKQGRVWRSYPSDLKATFAWCHKGNLPHPLSIYIGLLLGRYFRNLALPITIKWPNDIYLNGHKIGGILVEVSETKVFVGIGINICNDHAGHLKGWERAQLETTIAALLMGEFLQPHVITQEI